jgi:S-adenosylmethionine:tRNA ribosyltransferase-isomerase
MPLLKSDYCYHLPERLIAAHPLDRREQSRMMVLNRKDQSVQHLQFYRFPDLLEPGSVLVINDSKVIPARLPGTRLSGGTVDVLLVENLGNNTWSCKIKNSARLKPGETLSLCNGKLKARLIGKRVEGECVIGIDASGDVFPLLEQVGFAPLPPYIQKVRKQKADREEDLARYQTVYAQSYGSIAAPTAGFHFTDSLLAAIREKGIEVVSVTLHVGLGTFEPIRVDDVLDHVMHEEKFEISTAAATAIQTAKAEGRKIVAVGTTTTRTLEAAWCNGTLQTGRQKTRMFIYPPYRYRVVDHLLTNFHLPESTLLMLVSAFAGKEYILNAYQEAVLHRYRFFSFGDCMFIR